MVVCHIRKIVFIHIPKTGGTSIEQMMREGGKYQLYYLGVRNKRSMHHYMAKELKAEMGRMFDVYRKFSFVRNPYDRIVSEYFWCPFGKRKNVGFDDFLKYVGGIIKSNNYFSNIYHDHFIPQYYFLFDDNNRQMIDYIFKFEDFENAVGFIKSKFKLNGNLPHLNKGGREELILTEEQKEKIYQMYKVDFDIFNYAK